MSETTEQSPAPGNKSGTGPSGTCHSTPSVPAEIDYVSFLHGYDSGQATGFVQGQCEGFTAGFKQAESEMKIALTAQIDAQLRDAQTIVNRAVVHDVLARGNFAELSRKRGQPERAARQEWLIETNGVTA